MFKNDLETIDDLRRDAVNVREPHSSGIVKLQKYAAQLLWISGKFPIDVGGPFIRIGYAHWTDQICSLEQTLLGILR